MAGRDGSIVRRLAAFASAGLLLQAGGCSVNLSETIQTLLLATVNNLIASAVFGAFNLPEPSSFGF